MRYCEHFLYFFSQLSRATFPSLYILCDLCYSLCGIFDLCVMAPEAGGAALYKHISSKNKRFLERGYCG